MNHYEILEVSPNASPEVIRAAYKSLMQRYHPDRNPDSAETAEHAILIGQAYEMLSDPDRRAAYDIKLKQISDYLSDSRDENRGVLAQRVPVIKDSASYLYLWLLFVLIILSGWLTLSSSKKQQSPESELKEIRLSFSGKLLSHQQMQAKIKRIDEIFKENPDLFQKEAGERALEVATRTIPIYITNLTVNLRGSDKVSDASGNSSVDAGHVLSIPVLGIVVGTFDTNKFIRHIENNNEFISRKLAEKLVNAKYEDLIKTGGESYLKNFILDSLGEITGTNRYEEYPSSYAEAPGRYGVVDALFPESFLVH